jgi:hypothetical protein
MGFAFKSTVANEPSQPIIGFINNAGAEASLGFNSETNTFTASKGYTVGGTILGSGTYPIGTISYHWIELQYVMNATVGTFNVWVDNTQIITAIGVDTTNYGNTTFATVTIGSDTSNNGVQGYYDDLYILNTSGSTNTTRLGDSRIETLRPSSDAGPNDGTPTVGGAHYLMVDSLQNDGGSNTLTLTNTVSQEELFGTTSLSGTPSTIFAVKVLNIAEKTDAGSCYANSVISSSGVVATGNNTILLTSYYSVSGIFETDPNTSSAWAYSAVNSADAGFSIA